VVFFYVHQRPHLGPLLALLASLAVWLNPGYRRLCTEVMSDVPGLALVLGCLLIERWASRRPSRVREIVLGLSIGLSVYVRTIVVLLVPAIVLMRLFVRWRKETESAPWWRFAVERIAILLVATWLVLLPWNIARSRDLPQPPADQTLNYSLSTAMWHEDPGDPGSRRYGPGEILARVAPRLGDLAVVVGSRLQHRIPGSPPPSAAASMGCGALALVMAACWLAVLYRRRAAAEWFVAGTLFVVTVYFIFTERLALPLFVFGLAATVEVSRDVLRRYAGSIFATVLPAAALLLLIAVDFSPRPRWDEVRTRHREFEALASAVNEILPDDARVAAGQGFHYGVYLERPVYNLMHAARRARRPDAVEQIIDKYEINTVVLSPLVPPDLPLVPYFNQRYGPGTPVAGARVWRVRD